MTARTLSNLEALKACRAGERVTFRARVLRFWEVGGLRMCLVADESALTRIDIGEGTLEPDGSYEFRNLLVREYPGGWHSAAVSKDSEVTALVEDVATSQDEAYVERTYKILTGVQRKKGRRGTGAALAPLVRRAELGERALIQVRGKESRALPMLSDLWKLAQTLPSKRCKW
jgi:hypothetical protein